MICDSVQERQGPRQARTIERVRASKTRSKSFRVWRVVFETIKHRTRVARTCPKSPAAAAAADSSRQKREDSVRSSIDYYYLQPERHAVRRRRSNEACFLLIDTGPDWRGAFAASYLRRCGQQRAWCLSYGLWPGAHTHSRPQLQAYVHPSAGGWRTEGERERERERKGEVERAVKEHGWSGNRDLGPG
jgi:hypothetical protein